jgi:hypothetical protein
VIRGQIRSGQPPMAACSWCERKSSHACKSKVGVVFERARPPSGSTAHSFKGRAAARALCHRFLFLVLLSHRWPCDVLVAPTPDAPTQGNKRQPSSVQIAPYTFAFYYLGRVSRERLRFYDSSLVILDWNRRNIGQPSGSALSFWIINFATCNH